jgi:hypothetical protein
MQEQIKAGHAAEKVDFRTQMTGTIIREAYLSVHQH